MGSDTIVEQKPKKTSKRKTTKPRYVEEEVNTYDIWKTLEKFAIEAIILAVIAVLTYFVNTAFPEMISTYPEYAFIFVACGAVATGLLNYLKHRNDTETIKVDTKTGLPVE